MGRPHGLDGSFYVNRPMPHLPGPGGALCVGGLPAEVVGRKGTDGAPILRVSLARDRDAAEALRGTELTIAREAAGPLEEDEYWADELVGCVVVAGERELGTVGRMVAYPSCEVLVVGELLVPMVRDAVLAVDVEARRIDVDGSFLGLV